MNISKFLEIIKSKLVIIAIVILSTSCNNTDQMNNKKNRNIIDKSQKSQEKELIKVKIRCNNKLIKEYINKGWQIEKKAERNVTCTWKSITANSSCDIEKDKGCKLTVPDKIGKEYIYTLSR